ncbi:hypothetical protein [Pigmentiphaga sp.]|uniref:hypothetical protein n=1 Tax=Pigmentiphaga sp. TaxID=1977564 RepID=UPI0025F16225|nr:hypothetical protein [Pigmentiphaga sp.]MBX6317906.1 hypothetical protein [Pigmentiphaga sp.]
MAAYHSLLLHVWTEGAAMWDGSEGFDYSVLTFKKDADRWMAAWRLRQQGAHIEVRNVGDGPEIFELHVWMPKGPIVRTSVEQMVTAAKKKEKEEILACGCC